jgi:hypothetical protein
MGAPALAHQAGRGAPLLNTPHFLYIEYLNTSTLESYVSAPRAAGSTPSEPYAM